MVCSSSDTNNCTIFLDMVVAVCSPMNSPGGEASRRGDSPLCWERGSTTMTLTGLAQWTRQVTNDPVNW